MILFAIILLLTAIPFFFVSLAIYRGNTNLIHDYHQKKVTDKAAYGRAFGKSLFVICFTLALSGTVSLFGKTDSIAIAAVSILAVGLIAGIVLLLAVQKKYNEGLF